MIEGEVTSRRALRDAYLDAVGREIDARRFDISGGELDGVPVVTVKDLEEALSAVFAGPPPGSPDGFAEVATPANVLVHAECPRCGIPAEINVVIGAVLTVEVGDAELGVKAKSKARTHVCGQLPLEAGPAIEGEQTTIDFDAIIGPTREELVVDRDPAEPTDLAESDDDACAAEAEVPNLYEGATEPTVLLSCDRSVDHEGDHYSGSDVEGETPIGWHYETSPAPQGVEGNEDAVVGDQEGESDGEADD